ncbi:MAG: ABC transporter permease [Acetatifactor sp.]|nr:ABC transporter permease [Acetatifactor sp.]
MTNYLKSEFYRVFRTKALYIMTGACLMVVLLFLTVLWAMSAFTVDFPWATTKYAFSTLEADMHIPLYLSAVMGSLVVSDELKYKTFNNSVAFGIPREQVYLSKVIVGAAASALCLLVTETGLIGGGYLLLENSGAVYTLSLLKGTAACIPAWIAGMVAIISLYYVTGSNNASIWMWLLVIVAAPAVVSVLGMRFKFCARLASWLLYPMVSSVTPTEEWLEFSWSTAAGFLKCQEAGIIGVAVFITLGILGIRRREL